MKRQVDDEAGPPDQPQTPDLYSRQVQQRPRLRTTDSYLALSADLPIRPSPTPTPVVRIERIKQVVGAEQCRRIGRSRHGRGLESKRASSGRARIRCPQNKIFVDLFGVARDTARRAVQMLRDQELVLIIPHRGTYVVPEDQRPTADHA